jgi:hypothetical protein
VTGERDGRPLRLAGPALSLLRRAGPGREWAQSIRSFRVLFDSTLLCDRLPGPSGTSRCGVRRPLRHERFRIGQRYAGVRPASLGVRLSWGLGPAASYCRPPRSVIVRLTGRQCPQTPVVHGPSVPQVTTHAIQVSSGSVPLVTHRPLVPLCRLGDPAGPSESLLPLASAPVLHDTRVASVRPSAQHNSADIGRVAASD